VATVVGVPGSTPQNDSMNPKPVAVDRPYWARRPNNMPGFSAPRHQGLMNVLYYDSHVETKIPLDIDPRGKPGEPANKIHENLWRPTMDRDAIWDGT
jgi:prepilin-type processing-associated H-X9-DG protein